MSRYVKISDAQYTALETAGIFECPYDDEMFLVNSIERKLGRAGVTSKIKISDDMSRDFLASIVNDLSNKADEIAHSGECDDAARNWYAKDARALSTLYANILRS